MQPPNPRRTAKITHLRERRNLMDKKIKILFVCHGNICRSTMAQSVFQDMVNKAGLAERFDIDSAATSTEEIGNPPHHGTAAELRRHGIPIIPHRARQLTKADAENQ